MNFNKIIHIVTGCRQFSYFIPFLKLFLQIRFFQGFFDLKWVHKNEFKIKLSINKIFLLLDSFYIYLNNLMMCLHKYIHFLNDSIIIYLHTIYNDHIIILHKYRNLLL